MQNMTYGKYRLLNPSNGNGNIRFLLIGIALGLIIFGNI